ncbi:MAG: T9SS type A sorting domain-containing protein [Flavobacteriaceae bacterium]|nr:T9SS type A sorting domain-containing protein [Flavobacteriaceae bacterium]
MSPRFVYLLTLFSTLYLPMHGQIVNSDTLKIKENTVVYIAENFTNSGFHYNDGKLHFQRNFINDGKMDSLSLGTTFFDSSTLDIQSISGNVKKIFFNNLNVNLTSPTAEGVLVPDGYVIKVNDSIGLIKGNLRLQGETQLVQSHVGSSKNIGVGNIMIDQQGTSDVFNFNYWSSPVNKAGSFAVSDVLFDGTDAAVNPFHPRKVAMTSALNGAPTSPITLSNYWFFKFNNKAFDDPNGWETVAPTVAQNPAIGVTMKGSGASGSSQNYVFSGTPNDGDFSQLVGPDHFSLIGNPYPSALDANKFIIDNVGVMASGSGLFFWDHFGGGSHETKKYEGGYSVYTLAGGTAALAHPSVSQTIASGTKVPKRFIPVAQGFFVLANASGGNFVFNNAQRAGVTETSGKSIFTRANKHEISVAPKAINNLIQNTAADVLPKIRLGHEGAEGFHRQLLVAFEPTTTAGVDLGYDAAMLDVFTTDLFWYIDDKAFVIQALPFFTEMQIPLGVVSSVDQTHRFMIDALEDFVGDVYLIDLETSLSHRLNDGPVEIQVPQGQYTNRFILAFTQITLSTDENVFLSNDLRTFYLKQSGNIVIENNSNLDINKIQIYNLNGQSLVNVHENSDFQSSEINIPFSNYSTGIYLVKILSEQGTNTFKIVKN